MSFVQGPLEGTTLPAIADEIHGAELAIRLSRLGTGEGGKNYALHTDPAPTPKKGIVILPSPAVGPANSTKICDGKLTVSGVVMLVTAFRLK